MSKRPRRTKREVIRDCVSEFQTWLVDEKLSTAEDITALRKDNAVTTDKIVAYIEHFFLKPAQAGEDVLTEYVKQQIKEGRFLLIKAKKSKKGLDKYGKYAHMNITDTQVDGCVQRLLHIIRIMCAR